MINPNQIQLFESALRAHSLRITNARRAVFALLSNSNEPLTIAEIIKSIESAHFVSIYRTMDTLAKAGIVRQVTIGFTTRYELSERFKPHHHHITCEKCGKSVPVESQEVERLMEELTRQAGLRPTSHHFEAYGVCVEHANSTIA
jgi:Fe2+ or Zn2+ uptake regulation protein